MTTQDIEQLLEQVEELLSDAKNTVDLSELISEEDFDKIDAGWLRGSIENTEAFLNQFKIKLWQQQIKEL